MAGTSRVRFPSPAAAASRGVSIGASFGSDPGSPTSPERAIGPAGRLTAPVLGGLSEHRSGDPGRPVCRVAVWACSLWDTACVGDRWVRQCRGFAALAPRPSRGCDGSPRRNRQSIEVSPVLARRRPPQPSSDPLWQVLPRGSRCGRAVRGLARVPPLLELFLRPQIRRGYPLNLSILVSGGKETNKDSLSNGE